MKIKIGSYTASNQYNIGIEQHRCNQRKLIEEFMSTFPHYDHLSKCRSTEISFSFSLEPDEKDKNLFHIYTEVK